MPAFTFTTSSKLSRSKGTGTAERNGTAKPGGASKDGQSLSAFTVDDDDDSQTPAAAYAAEHRRSARQQEEEIRAEKKKKKKKKEQAEEEKRKEESRRRQEAEQAEQAKSLFALGFRLPNDHPGTTSKLDTPAPPPPQGQSPASTSSAFLSPQPTAIEEPSPSLSAAAASSLLDSLEHRFMATPKIDASPVQPTTQKTSSYAKSSTTVPEKARATDEETPTPKVRLTPVQRHYLIKSLVCLRYSTEWAGLGVLGGITAYAPPFSPTPTKLPPDAPAFDPKAVTPAPLLSQQFREHLMTFPGLDTAPTKYWQRRIQPFFDAVALSDLSTTTERNEPTKRQQLALFLTRILGSYFARGVGIAVDGKGPPKGQRFAAPIRAGKDVAELVDDVFPGKGKVSPDGWWVAVTEDVGLSRGEEQVIVMARQTEKKAVIFSRKAAERFDELDAKLRSLVENPDRLPCVPTSTTSKCHRPFPLRLQTYLRVLLSSPPDVLPSTARNELIAFLSDSTADLLPEQRTRVNELVKEREETLAEEHRVWVKAGERTDLILNSWRQFVGEIVEDPKALDRAWDTLQVGHIKNLPLLYHHAVMKASIWVAYMLHAAFVTAPNAAELLGIVRVLHVLTPWWGIRQLLRIADPSKMIAALLAVVLARPLGANSLLQQIFSSVWGGERRKMGRQAEKVKEKVLSEAGKEQGSTWCKAVEEFVHSKPEQRAREVKSAAEKGKPLVAVIVNAPLPPKCLALLTRYLSLLSSVRDAGAVVDFASSAALVKVIKDSLNVVFYGPLSKWSKACDLSERLKDLEAFLGDLIKTARGSDKSLASFIKLCDRHNQSLYYLFHEAHVRGGDLLDPLREWCRKGLRYLRTSSLDLEASNQQSAPHMRVDVDALVSDSLVSSETQAAILKEVDDVARWTKWNKVWWAVDIRKNLLAAAEDGPDQALSVQLSEEVDVDEVVTMAMRRTGEQVAVDAVDGSGRSVLMGENDGEEGEDEAASFVSGPSLLTTNSNGSAYSNVASPRPRLSPRDHFAWAWFAPPEVYSVLDDTSKGYKARAGAGLPRLEATRKLVPLFLRKVGGSLRRANETQKARVSVAMAAGGR